MNDMKPNKLFALILFLVSFSFHPANAQSWAQRQEAIQRQNNMEAELFIQQQEMEDARRKQEKAMRDMERQ